MRHRVSLSIFCALTTAFVAILSAQQSDVIKERALEIRKADAPDETPTPSKSPSPKKKKKSSPTPTAKPKSRATPKKTPEEDSASPAASPKKKKTAAKSSKESPSPKKKKKKSSPSPSPKKKKSPAKEKETASPKASASAPKAIAVPSATAAAARDSGTSNARSTTTLPLAAPVDEAEQLTIEKSGSERPRSFWERVFGGGRRSSARGAGYHYLSAAVRAAIDRVGPDRRNPRWQLIVVHNSGTRQGNARVFDYYHRHVRHMQNGLAYHFVIGNGTSTGNGQIEIGDRWRRQINGGHVHSDYLNNIAIGICLVGDFNRDQPTRAQLECCEELVRYLRQGCGKFDNSHFPLVRPHREVNPPRWGTDCPGDAFPYSWFRRFRD